MRSRKPNIASNSVLIGAATVLVALVAMFLAYNANNGLPFVPTYKLKAELPSAANLVVGNEVRLGGARVGTVSDIQPRPRRNGEDVALLSLKLDKAIEELPEDSTVVVRLRSLLGLKYLEITRGESRDGLAAGSTIPLRQARPAQVEFDELIDTFDAPTRAAMADNTVGLGTALAGRGESINTAIGAFRPLLTQIIPVARYLRSEETRLAPTIEALARIGSITAPVADEQGEMFVELEQTFGALAAVARPYLQETIAEQPATLDQGIRTLRRQRPFLANTTRFVRELRPGVRALRGAAPALSDALGYGTPVLKRTPALNRRLVGVLRSLRGFSEDPVVTRGVRSLTSTVRTLRPTLEYIGPAQTQCNYMAGWFNNVSDLLSVGDSSGTTQRFTLISPPKGPNTEAITPSAKPASYLHSNPYPNTAAPGQPVECEAGNEPYMAGQQVIGNPAGTQSASTSGKP